MDQSALARALAKAVAYKRVGQQEKAELWAVELIKLLECSDILGRQTITWHDSHRGELV
jgi:hypothetical protein